MKKAVFFILLAAVWLTACGGAANSLVFTPVPTAAPPLPLPHSMKGYELYSWQTQGQWHFTLMTGTNRLKSLEEITSGENTVSPDGWARISVQGADALKGILGRLPPHEEIFWVGKPQVEQTGFFELPPQEIMDAIKEYCKQLGLALSVS